MVASHWLQRLLARLVGRRSLHRQLLLWLLLPQLVLWLAAAVVTYKLAARHANQAIDASLSQASRSLARQVKPTGSGLLIDFPRAAQDIIEADPDDRVYYMVSSPPGQFILGSRVLPAPPAQAGPGLPREPQFYDAVVSVKAGDGASDGASDGTTGRTADRTADAAPRIQRVRVAALYLKYGESAADPQTMLVQVARSSANREELARRILIDTLLPLSGLIVLMTMIVFAGIRAGLAPLVRLRRLVEGRAANDLHPIELAAAPQEVRALAQAINDLLDAVQRSMGAQRRFISDAAHQLRTPLAGLKSQTELALRDTSEPALAARLQRVHESATRSAHLVNQLLTLARAEPDGALLQPRQSVDLALLAREVTAELVPRALACGIDLGCADDADGADSGSSSGSEHRGALPVRVSGDALLLREALINVIDNALRYAGRGAEVTVQVRSEGPQAVVEIVDNGPGLPAGLESKVFERFVRGHTEGNGCGLGLAIVKEITERQGGKVQVSGLQPQGLRVRLEMPLSR